MALLVFSAVTIAHFRLFRTTGASIVVLVIALVATLGTFVVFCTTTLVNEPATALALVAISGRSRWAGGAPPGRCVHRRRPQRGRQVVIRCRGVAPYAVCENRG